MATCSRRSPLASWPPPLLLVTVMLQFLIMFMTKQNGGGNVVFGPGFLFQFFELFLWASCGDGVKNNVAKKKRAKKSLIFKAVNLLAFPGVRRSAEDVFTLCESFFSRNLHIVHLNFLSVFPLKNVDFVEQIARY